MFASYAYSAFGIILLIVLACIGVALLIGFTVQRINTKRGLDKDDIKSSLGKRSLAVMIILGSIAFIGLGILLYDDVVYR